MITATADSISSTMRELIKARANVHLKNHNGETALSQAIANAGMFNTNIEHLVKAGAVIDDAVKNQIYRHEKCEAIWRAVHTATDSLDEKRSAELSKEEAEKRALTKNLWKLLQNYKGDYNAYAETIRKAVVGADLQAKNRHGQNALTQAIIYEKFMIEYAKTGIHGTGSSDIFDILIEHGAPVDHNEIIKISYGQEALAMIRHSQEKAQRDAVKELWKAVDTNNPNALRAAVAKPHAHVNAPRALGERAQPLWGSTETTSPLMTTAEKGSLALVQILLQAGAQVNKRDAHGYTALTRAVKPNNTAVIQELMRAGADINHTTPGRRSVLTAAIENNAFDAVKVLVEAGAIINPERSYLPLERAAANNRLEISQYLIQHGADVDARDAGNGTALDSAIRWNHYDIVRELVLAGATVVPEEINKLSNKETVWIAIKEAYDAMQQAILEHEDLHQLPQRGIRAIIADYTFPAPTTVPTFTPEELKAAVLRAGGRNDVATVRKLLHSGVSVPDETDIAKVPEAGSERYFAQRVIETIVKEMQAEVAHVLKSAPKDEPFLRTVAEYLVGKLPSAAEQKRKSAADAETGEDA